MLDPIALASLGIPEKIIGTIFTTIGLSFLSWITFGMIELLLRVRIRVEVQREANANISD